MNQSPGPNTQAPPGSQVTIYVSAAASVPDVRGLPQASAEASLQSSGFKVSAETVAGPAWDRPPGTVWQQTPNANTTAAPGTTVTILVQPAASAPATPTGSGARP